MPTVGVSRFRAIVISWCACLLAFGGMARAQSVDLGGPEGHPGGTVAVTATFAGDASGASALKVDLGFAPNAPIASRDGRPACFVNPAIMKESTSFVFLPRACTPAKDCSMVRAAIISFTPENNPVPIPDGVVFSCLFTIPGDANPATEFDVDIVSASAIFPDGRDLDITGTSRGTSVRVLAPLCPGDTDGDNEVTLGEVQKAFAAYLDGCD